MRDFNWIRSKALPEARRGSKRISGGFTLRTEECSCQKVNNANASRVRSFSQAREGLILLAFVLYVHSVPIQTKTTPKWKGPYRS
ncbi:hypothetical protein HN51_040543 [Arachis hypogaea]